MKLPSIKHPREFWIEDAPFAATTRGFYQKHIAYTEEMEKPKTSIHLIEYSAFERANKLIELLGGMAGNPDAKEGCRLICQKVVEWMDQNK